MSKEKTSIDSIDSIGTIIDSNLEEFQSYIRDSNVGILLNLKLLLETAYSELKVMKDLVIQSNKISPEEVSESVHKIYAEMFKIEDKCIVLTNRISELTKEVFDTEKS